MDVCYLLQLADCAQEVRSHRSDVECSYSLHAASQAECVNMSMSLAESLCEWSERYELRGLVGIIHTPACLHENKHKHIQTHTLTLCFETDVVKWENPAHCFETTQEIHIKLHTAIRHGCLKNTHRKDALLNISTREYSVCIKTNTHTCAIHA